MARRELRILSYKGDRDYQYYLDGLKVNGKRKRLFFKTEKEALEELKKRGMQLRKEGEEGQAISADLRILAAKCAERLKPFGKTICGTQQSFSLLIWKQGEASSPVSILSADYQQTKSRAVLSKKHIEDVRQRLARFAAHYGEREPEASPPHQGRRTNCERIDRPNAPHLAWRRGVWLDEGGD